MSNIPQIKLSTPNPPTMRLNNVPNVADERSRIWAEGTDAEVEALGGEHSAKNWVKENPTVITKPTKYELPNIGKVGVVYVVEEENACYRWDATGSKYYCVGRDYTELEIIDGGNANG